MIIIVTGYGERLDRDIYIYIVWNSKIIIVIIIIYRRIFFLGEV